uniref:MyTH4 domain-containing protein n=1 Tax=Serinus canaria TaxID=9135 RepID=A0A8C9N246_SERCA
MGRAQASLLLLGTLSTSSPGRGSSREVFSPPHSGKQAGLLQPRGHRECQEGDRCRGAGWLRGVLLPPLPCHGEGPAVGISPGCSHRDSCQRGWRLLYILAAYYKCSEVLRPFLLAFLQDASRHPELPFHGIAKACEQNLRKTLQFGGRSLFPSSMELKAMVAGRSAKRQLFLLPGGIERHLKIRTCSVSQRGQESQCTPRLW